VSVVVHPVTVVAAPQLALQPADRGIECGVEVGAAGFSADGGALAAAGDRDPLGRLRLTRVLLLVQFDVVADGVAAEVSEVGEVGGCTSSPTLVRFPLTGASTSVALPARTHSCPATHDHMWRGPSPDLHTV